MQAPQYRPGHRASGLPKFAISSWPPRTIRRSTSIFRRNDWLLVWNDFFPHPTDFSEQQPARASAMTEGNPEVFGSENIPLCPQRPRPAREITENRQGAEGGL